MDLLSVYHVPVTHIYLIVTTSTLLYSRWYYYVTEEKAEDQKNLRISRWHSRELIKPSVGPSEYGALEASLANSGTVNTGAIKLSL